jgi:hypothetical protein
LATVSGLPAGLSSGIAIGQTTIKASYDDTGYNGDAPGSMQLSSSSVPNLCRESESANHGW